LVQSSDDADFEPDVVLNSADALLYKRIGVA